MPQQHIVASYPTFIVLGELHRIYIAHRTTQKHLHANNEHTHHIYPLVYVCSIDVYSHDAQANINNSQHKSLLREDIKVRWWCVFACVACRCGDDFVRTHLVACCVFYVYDAVFALPSHIAQSVLVARPFMDARLRPFSPSIIVDCVDECKRLRSRKWYQTHTHTL